MRNATGDGTWPSRRASPRANPPIGAADDAWAITSGCVQTGLFCALPLTGLLMTACPVGAYIA
jgi:hypothetical protein